MSGQAVAPNVNPFSNVPHPFGPPYGPNLSMLRSRFGPRFDFPWLGS